LEWVYLTCVSLGIERKRVILSIFQIQKRDRNWMDREERESTGSVFHPWMPKNSLNRQPALDIHSQHFRDEVFGRVRDPGPVKAARVPAPMDNGELEAGEVRVVERKGACEEGVEDTAKRPNV
jgi:hypothetical protein